MWEEHYVKGLRFLFLPRTGMAEYKITRMVGSNEMEMAHLFCGRKCGGHLTISDIQVLKHQWYFKGYEGSHMGTNLLSDALTDMYFRQDIHCRIITGRLAQTDAESKWSGSIPFYRDFPKYLNPKLPYALRFDIYEDREHSILVPAYLSAEDIIAKYGGQDLYFIYHAVAKNGHSDGLPDYPCASCRQI